MTRTWVCLACCSTLFAGCVQRDDDETGRPFEPYRGPWMEVAGPLSFPHTAPDGTPRIRSITIGGEPESTDGAENFANRGDVIVQFWDREDIEIEYRPFTMARSEAAAWDSMALLEVLATAGEVTRPDRIRPEDDCLEGWQDACEIRVWQAGRSQETHSGADLRVTLPRSYRHSIEVATSDLSDSAYHNRGNVCVEGLPGSLSAQVDFGQVFVSLAEDITPAPGCPADAVAACDASGWDDSCTCTGSFGAVSIDSRRDSFNAFISIPRRLWAYARLRGAPECRRSIESEGFVADVDDPRATEGSLFAPPDVPTGYGYQLLATAQDCTTVPSTEGPMIEEIEDQLQLGNAIICHDCEMSCAQLMGG